MYYTQPFEYDALAIAGPFNFHRAAGVADGFVGDEVGVGIIQALALLRHQFSSKFACFPRTMIAGSGQGPKS